MLLIIIPTAATSFKFFSSFSPRLKAYDRHMNMVLESVREMWVEMPKGKKSQAKNKDRYVSKLFLRGDNIVLVMRNPK